MWFCPWFVDLIWPFLWEVGREIHNVHTLRSPCTLALIKPVLLPNKSVNFLYMLCAWVFFEVCYCFLWVQKSGLCGLFCCLPACLDSRVGFVCFCSLPLPLPSCIGCSWWSRIPDVGFTRRFYGLFRASLEIFSSPWSILGCLYSSANAARLCGFDRRSRGRAASRQLLHSPTLSAPSTALPSEPQSLLPLFSNTDTVEEKENGKSKAGILDLSGCSAKPAAPFDAWLGGMKKVAGIESPTRSRTCYAPTHRWDRLIAGRRSGLGRRKKNPGNMCGWHLPASTNVDRLSRDVYVRASPLVLKKAP